MDDSFSICCMRGKVKLPVQLKPPPPLLINLIKNEHPKSKGFVENIRHYNLMFAFTSLGGKINHNINDGRGPYCFRIQGENYHTISDLMVKPNEMPKFAQLYMFDTQNELQNIIDVPHDKLRTTWQIDKYISAEIPDKDTHPDLYQLVTKNMTHVLCGLEHQNYPCMVKNRCTKKFLKEFNKDTFINENGYAIYKRPDNGRTMKKSRTDLDHGFIVPYNPGLLKCYQAHINVEYCNQFSSIKYMLKYINKGPDRVTIVVDDEEVDEIKDYYDCKYLSACEASWRIFQFDIHHRTPSVERLPFHLPDEHSIIFDESDSIDYLLEKDSNNITKFLQWMGRNKIDDKARELLSLKTMEHMPYPNAEYIMEGYNSADGDLANSKHHLLYGTRHRCLTSTVLKLLIGLCEIIAVKKIMNLLIKCLEDFSKVDAFPSTNNEDKIFNPCILIQEKLVEIITRVVQDKKLAISNASLVFEDFDPLFYEPLFFKEVPKGRSLYLMIVISMRRHAPEAYSDGTHFRGVTESVGTSTAWVILFDMIPTNILATVPIVDLHVVHDDTPLIPTETPTISPVVPTLPQTSPFLWIDSFKTSNDFAERPPSHDTYEEIPLGRPYRTQPNGVRKMLPARKRVWALPSGHLASRSPVTSVPLATPTPGALSLADIDANTAAAETAAALEVGIGIEVDVGVEVQFLGHVIDSEGIHVNPTKIKSIKDWASPKTPIKICQFLGLADYNKKFIDGFLKITKPMTKLTQKSMKFDWVEREEAAFQMLKQKLCSAPILALPEGSENFTVYCDVSHKGLSAVLMQKEKCIAYYLYGTKCVVFTDHKSLQHILDQKELNMRQHRWLKLLSNYDCEIRYNSGKVNVMDNALSRKERIKPLRV
nr:reverse transcriptase domain-containing protein [Tanacetum cinerariifolium]